MIVLLFQSLVLFDYSSGSVAERWSGHEKEVTKVTYGHEVQAAFSASRDLKVKMWKRGESSSAQSYIGHDLVITGLALNSGDYVELIVRELTGETLPPPPGKFRGPIFPKT